MQSCHRIITLPYCAPNMIITATASISYEAMTEMYLYSSTLSPLVTD